MNGFRLKYGCNPQQSAARLYMDDGAPLPFEVLNGAPGYINFLDALNGWQLVSELRAACGLPAAASFKHVSPAGAALGLPLDDITLRAARADEAGDLSPVAAAYARARGADRLSSFGDFIALSDECDASCARLIKREVSDGIIAPAYSPEALAILSAKRGGRYNIIRIDPLYAPPSIETRQVFGVTFQQRRDAAAVDPSLFDAPVTAARLIPGEARRDLTLALITLKYTQSNSVCYAYGGQTVGVGAGQQSRVHCTRLAGDKADMWCLRRHPRALSLPFLPSLGRAERDNATDIFLSTDPSPLLDAWPAYFTARPDPLSPPERLMWLSAASGVSLASDAFFPFADNIERAHMSGVQYIAQPGGSVRDADVVAACDKYGIAMAVGFPRLFHH